MALLQALGGNDGRSIEALQTEMDTVAVDYLLKRGYVVEMPGEWEKPGEFCDRIGISVRTFQRHVRSKWRPQVDIEEGPNGRINKVRSNKLFDDFMRKHGSRQKTARSGQVSDRNGAASYCRYRQLALSI